MLVNMKSLFYLAPEIVNKNVIYPDKVDVWSIGLILYDLLNTRIEPLIDG